MALTARLPAPCKDSLKKLIILLFLVIPLLAVAIATIMGGILAALEGWSYEDTFWVVMSQVCGVKGITIAPIEHPETHTGKIVGCIIGLISVTILAAIAGTMGKPLLKPIAVWGGFNFKQVETLDPKQDEIQDTLKIERIRRTGKIAISWVCRKVVRRRERLYPLFPAEGLGQDALQRALVSIGFEGLTVADTANLFGIFNINSDGVVTWAEIVEVCLHRAEHDRMTTQVVSAVKLLLVLVFLIIPAFALIVSAIFGGFLAFAEGWSYENSFYLVFAELTHTNLAVVPHDAHVENFLGKIIACLIGIVALGVFVFAVGVAGGPLMEPITEACGFKPGQALDPKEEHEKKVRRMTAALEKQPCPTAALAAPALAPDAAPPPAEAEKLLAEATARVAALETQLAATRDELKECEAARTGLAAENKTLLNNRPLEFDAADDAADGVCQLSCIGVDNRPEVFA